jgi:hypothetical protein
MRSHILCIAVLGSMVLHDAAFLHADPGETRRDAWLVPPAGAPVPEARGQVSIGTDGLAVLAEGLEPGEYPVLLEDGTGPRTTIGVLVIAAVIDASLTEDRPQGQLMLGVSDLPFNAASALELGGRAIDVAGSDGTILLAGKMPEPITEEPEERAGRCSIGRPEPAPDPDAEGILKTESRGGRVVIKVHIKNLAPRTVYRASFIDPSDGSAEVLGAITTDAAGNGQLKIDSASGDPIPFGAGDLTSLVGLGVEVSELGGARVLGSAVCEPEIVKPETDEDDDALPVEGCTLELELPPAAPIADAQGEVGVETVEGKGSELDVEIKIDIPGAAYEVALTEPGKGGATETIGRVVMGCNGVADVEIKDQQGQALPFGKKSVVELSGYKVSVTDESGHQVLRGEVPYVDCPEGVSVDDEDDGTSQDEHDDEIIIIIPGCSAGAVPPNLIDGPLFHMIGDFDGLFYRGDVNGDQRLTISDPVGTLLLLFKGEARPRCLDSADFNDDGALDLSDAVDELHYLFIGDRWPPMPGALIKGSDPTPDGLYCAE